MHGQEEGQRCVLGPTSAKVWILFSIFFSLNRIEVYKLDVKFATRRHSAPVRTQEKSEQHAADQVQASHYTSGPQGNVRESDTDGKGQENQRKRMK